MSATRTEGSGARAADRTGLWNRRHTTPTSCCVLGVLLFSNAQKLSSQVCIHDHHLRQYNQIECNQPGTFYAYVLLSLYGSTTLVGLCLIIIIIIKASLSHSDTPQSVAFLWMSDRSVAETSTWQHTTLTTDRHPCPWRDSNPRSQPASGHTFYT